MNLEGVRYTDRLLWLLLYAMLFPFAIVRLDMFNNYLANAELLNATLGEIII